VVKTSAVVNEVRDVNKIFENKVALVTGATSGTGLAAAQAFTARQALRSCGSISRRMR
jgi:NADP-dependent 3-hydroxy acid dehydrogenase YdfG